MIESSAVAPNGAILNGSGYHDHGHQEVFVLQLLPNSRELLVDGRRVSVGARGIKAIEALYPQYREGTGYFTDEWAEVVYGSSDKAGNMRALAWRMGKRLNHGPVKILLQERVGTSGLRPQHEHAFYTFAPGTLVTRVAEGEVLDLSAPGLKAGRNVFIMPSGKRLEGLTDRQWQLICKTPIIGREPIPPVILADLVDGEAGDVARLGTFVSATNRRVLNTKGVEVKGIRGLGQGRPIVGYQLVDRDFDPLNAGHWGNLRNVIQDLIKYRAIFMYRLHAILSGNVAASVKEASRRGFYTSGEALALNVMPVFDALVEKVNKGENLGGPEKAVYNQMDRLRHALAVSDLDELRDAFYLKLLHVKSI
ncbi:hypothetical protein HYW42_02415 [Candidatus Daviesbacteria bacterium]|nr:hypothetical protein [Candidatus Daviesbacteria bacterium]